ncbi:hypothetical protein C9374_003458 [Naegleria lovaniensis]|uniref:EF-hand domain-containing protein n=1 Tax=Naegleria lovaniensis TaxID=51637 RepID=A0AA88KKD3_NAELO|nr:uncharacterized protein C9374_003458 [Naegleria lovaniensis]KAG2385643.1 hypothetical protein C9374_003458 [Naegleria lovaniensis]
MQSPTEIDRIKEVYDSYDYQDLGYIEASDARDAFIELGYEITLDEMLKLIDEESTNHGLTRQSSQDSLNSARNSEGFNPDKIEWYLFMELLQKYSALKDDEANEEDLLDAFSALGGNYNKSGTVSLSDVKSFCEKFDLCFDVMQVAKEKNISIDGHKLDYAQFKAVLSFPKN